MKFSINTELFSQSIEPAVDIALKNTIAEHLEQINKDDAGIKWL